MKLIDKSAVVAEIKRHISIAESQLALFGNEDERNRILWAQQKKVCEIILSFLDTLEVKEVNLEKEYEEFVMNDHVYNKLVNGIVGKAIAKHFFELGIKAAQKGE